MLTSPILHFGVFEADLTTGELRKNGRPVKLQPQPFKVLAFLLERSGELVTREEIHRALWGGDTFVDFEQGLNFAIKKIREALGDSAERPDFIETLPRRGYRFIAPIEGRTNSRFRGESFELPPAPRGGRVVTISSAIPASAEPSEVQDAPAAARAGAATPAEPIPSSPGIRPAPLPVSKSAAKASPLPWRVLLIVLVFALLAYTSVSRFLVVPSPLPKVLRSVQLSHFGRLEVGSPVRTDGTRLYFTERTGGAWEIAEASAEGGEPTPILTPFSNVYLTDIDPTETKLLVGLQGPEPDSPLWVLPAAGGSARRLGDVVAADAAWSPDGRQIVYSRGTAVYLVGADGSDVRKLVEAPGSALRLHWSPDGHRIGFTVADLKTTWRSLWEVGADGNNPHPLSLNWGTAPPTRAGWAEGECCGVWTPDGRYLVFRSIRQGVFSLWALREPPARGQALAPVQLYTSPDQIGPPSFSPDGNQVLFPDYHPTRELVRYDMSQKKFLPYLNGIPARFVSVSHDGRWVAYRNEADGALWRSRSDGTERLQLTFPPMDPYRSSWSPDGKRIVFDATVPGKQTSIYVVSSRGGIARKILEETDEEWAGSPSWSPDGRLLVFGRAGPTGGLYLFDWGSHAVRMVEGSGGLSAGQWSPNGRYLSAVGANSHGLMLFDLAARRWSELTSDSGLYSDGVRWSADSRYIFYQDLFLGREQPVFRVQVADRKVEKITSYGMIERADVTGFSLTGLAPDGSPLASLIHSNSDIYALQVEFPH